MRTFISRLAILCAAAIMVSACDRGTSLGHPTQPSPPAPTQAPAPPPPVRPLVREIQLNEVVEEDIERRGIECMTRQGFTVPCRQYQLTAPAGGTLLVTLSWDFDYTGMALMLKIGEEQFWRGSPEWSPVEARVKVVAGRTYALAVGLSGSDLFWGPFQLTTSLEP
jgi:hypothetical protein